MTKNKVILFPIVLVSLAVLFILEQHDYLNLRPRTVKIVPKVAQQPLSQIGQDLSIEVSDLLKIVYALERYKLDHKSYPISSSGGMKWDGLFSLYGQSREDWIFGLAPQYIDILPRDPRLLSDGAKQYVYMSNGVNYKLIAHQVDNCELIKTVYPLLVDPMRDCFAYGFWTERAAQW